MAISQPVLEPLREAEKQLREALAASTRMEKPHVFASVSKMIAQINTLINMTEFIEEMENKIPKKF